MEKMEIYEAGRKVPAEACRQIEAGRLKGFTDINPMWRIKRLTEIFGACGIGWYTEIIDKWSDVGSDGVVTANVIINLYVKVDGEWSRPIQGIGGNQVVANERNGLRTSDEAYKMAFTDAMSVACKSLGIGADIYYAKDRTKYTESTAAPAAPAAPAEPKEYKCHDCGKPFEAFTDKNKKVWSAGQVFHMAESNNTDGVARCRECSEKAGTRKAGK